MKKEKLFPLGGPVSEEDIVDRENFLSSLTNRLLEGQSITLAGPRRIGKTSLALEVLRRLRKEGCYTAFVDMFRISDRRDFALSIIDACLENRTGIRKTVSELIGNIKNIAGSASLALKLRDLEIDFRLLERDRDESRLLDYALDLPDELARKEKKQMVVVFDEFQEASRVAGGEIYKKMRAHFQMHKNVSYLFLGSKEDLMKNIFASSKQAFYRFALTLPIPPIPEDAWIEYIARKFASAGLTADEDSVREIVKLTGGHPQDTMIVCSEVYHFLLEASEKKLSLETVRIGYERALYALSPLFDRIIDELNENPHSGKVLKRITRGERAYSRKEHPNEVKRAIDFLMTKGVIEKSGRGVYKFTEPMFQEYILRELS
ncbi:AAA family ATPase [Desulfofundulus sp. TPOSR]|uniref:AAA family ATPase n=1 Tax=Desulfofundulus sp. TPOSR TaxID=2714340 RepID=UPI00140787A3|nr:ATP-binding protein [Desulfofundulus sp. TPOSR]NHM26505.1 AAA family ATPase [Desulfofundulus sp. TPOSR]